jgi:ATP-binding cassette subfamily F protein 3
MADDDGAASRAALEAALSASALQALDEAGVADYLAGILDDADAEESDLADTIAPMLLDVGAAGDDDEAAALCTAIIQARRGTGSGDDSSAPPTKLLSAPVSMFARLEADEKVDAAEAAKVVPKGLINYNSQMQAPVNSMIEEDESDEAVARRWKMQRRGEKQLKRAARREKVVAMQRDEFMKELTRDPVVLHWRGGTGSADILLKGVSMDINGLALLEACDLTLVSGRKYGLVGRNGIGKTYASRRRRTCGGAHGGVRTL